jgi:hypothetical protein
VRANFTDRKETICPLMEGIGNGHANAEDSSAAPHSSKKIDAAQGFNRVLNYCRQQWKCRGSCGKPSVLD